MTRNRLLGAATFAALAAFAAAAASADLPASANVRAAMVEGVNPAALAIWDVGNDALDDTTCRLIEERFRFDPSRDPQGRPVESMVVENHSWEIDASAAPR